MSYTKPNQKQFVDLAPDEFVVQLDDGAFVAVSALVFTEPNTGNAVIKAQARQVNGDGSEFIDGAGQTVCAAYTHSADVTCVEQIGGMEEFKRKMLLTVIGEDAQWPNPIDKTVLDHASIRTNIAAAFHSGPVTDAASLL
jgi:hypothetical protein